MKENKGFPRETKAERVHQHQTCLIRNVEVIYLIQKKKKKSTQNFEVADK